MSRFALVMLLIFLTGPVFSQDADSEVAPKKISDMEKTDCSKFRRMEGKDRYDQFKKVLHLFPSAKFTLLSNNTMALEEGSISFYMSEKELTELLGKALSDHGHLVYTLAPNHCTAYFAKTKAGGVYFVAYSNCPDKEKIEKN